MPIPHFVGALLLGVASACISMSFGERWLRWRLKVAKEEVSATHTAIVAELERQLARARELRDGAEAQARHFLSQRDDALSKCNKIAAVRRPWDPGTESGYFVGYSPDLRVSWKVPARRGYDPTVPPTAADINGSVEPIQMSSFVVFVHPGGAAYVMKSAYGGAVPTALQTWIPSRYDELPPGAESPWP